MPSTTLPRGIRNNNPGNLRSAVGPDDKTVLVDGFALFPSLLIGTKCLAYLIDQYYRVLGIKTIPMFVARYAPASENNVLAYERDLAMKLGLNPLRYQDFDLRLDQPWLAIDFMRAIIRIENGPCPLAFNGSSEWVAASTMVEAMQRTGKWPLL